MNYWKLCRIPQHLLCQLFHLSQMMIVEESVRPIFLRNTVKQMMMYCQMLLIQIIQTSQLKVLCRILQSFITDVLAFFQMSKDAGEKKLFFQIFSIQFNNFFLFLDILRFSIVRFGINFMQWMEQIFHAIIPELIHA